MQHLDERGDDAPARSRVARQMRGGDRSVTVYLVRHASTALNEAGSERVRGWCDVPLSRQGREEAEDLARELRSSRIDMVFSSDMLRAVDTAKPIARSTGAELIELRALRPWDLGELTGKAMKEADPAIENFACKKPDTAVPQGESFNTFRDRIFEGLKRIADYGAAVPAIIVHNHVERLLAEWDAQGQPPELKCDPETFRAKGLATSGVKRVAIDTAKLKAVKLTTP